MKTTLTLLTAFAFIFAISACGSGDNKPTLKKVDKSKSLTILRSDKSGDLDPHQTGSGGDVTVLSQMYECLIKASVGTEDVEWEPCLATKFAANDSQTEHTFTIREGVKFHDGENLNAEAVKISLNRLLAADAPSRPESRGYRANYADITSVEATDEFTLVIKSKRSNPRLFSNIGIHPAMVVSPLAIKKMAKMDKPADRSDWLEKHPAGTGPFTIKSAKDYKDGGQNITITAFDGYWDGAPKLERVTFITQKEVRQRTERLINADIQMTDNLDPGDWDSLEKNKDINLYTWPGMNLCYMSMTVSAHITANKRVREAIAMAINRDPFVAKFKNHAVPQYVLLPPRSLGFPKGYLPPEDRLSHDEAIAKAKKIIEDVGAVGTELELLMPDEPRPYLLYPPEIANIIEQQLAEIGLKVKPVPTPMTELSKAIASKDYALVLLGWMGDSGEPDNFYRDLMGGNENGEPNTYNAARFYDKEVMAAIDAAAVEPDESKRQTMYEDLEKLVFEKHRPMVPLISCERSYAWNTKVKGVIVDTTGTYHLHKAYIEE